MAKVGRPKGSSGIRKKSLIELLGERANKVAVDWLNDPDDSKAREGLKVLAPYLFAKLQNIQVTGDATKPLTINVIEAKLGSESN